MWSEHDILLSRACIRSVHTRSSNDLLGEQRMRSCAEVFAVAFDVRMRKRERYSKELNVSKLISKCLHHYIDGLHGPVGLEGRAYGRPTLLRSFTSTETISLKRH